MKLKKTLLVGLSFVLVAVIAIGGTLAYLTMNAGNEKNVFSVGNINVSLDEEVGVLGEGGEIKENTNGAEYIDIMPGDYLKKKVTVSNNGETDAYVAVTVTINNADIINTAIDDVYGDGNKGGQAMYDFIFDGWGINQNPRPDDNGGKSATGAKNAHGVIDGTYGLPEHVLKVDFSKTTDFDNDTTMFGTDNWFQNETEQNATKKGNYSAWLSGGGYHTSKLTDDPATAEDERDYIIVYTYYMYLPAGESSTLFKGLNVPAEFNAEQLAMFDGLEINVSASAIQADNMAVAAQYKNDTYGKAKTAFYILDGGEVPKDYTNKPTGDVTPAYASLVGKTSWNSIWGEAYTNAKESLVIKVYSGNTYLGSNTLNDLSKSDCVTWHCYFNGEDFESWTMNWEQKPTIDLVPTTVELWVDGEKVDETAVRMNCPDDLAPITGAVINANDEIVKFVTNKWTEELAAGETYVPFVSSTKELNAALSEGKTNLYLMPGEYTVANGTNKTLTINGTKDAVLIHENEGEGGCDYGFKGSTVTFNGVTIDVTRNTTGWEWGYAYMNGTYNNCTINGQYSLYGTSVFNNCTLNVSGDSYNIRTWGAPTATFTGCTFNSDGKALLLYGTANTKLTVKNCVFNDNGGLTDLKAAIEIGNDYGKSYELIVDNTVVNGYEINDTGINTGTTLWANKSSMGTDKLNVVVDGKDVY